MIQPLTLPGLGDLSPYQSAILLAGALFFALVVAMLAYRAR